MAADWSSTITVNIFLAPSPPARAGFGTALFLVNQDDGNSLNASRVMSFASSSEVDAAQAAGYISATTQSFLNAAFAQQPSPSKIKAAYRDVGGAETYAACLAAIIAADNDWYGIAQYSRVDQDIEDLATAIESNGKKLYVAQGDDASWLDAAIPAGIVDIDENERTAFIYHSADAQPADLCWLVSRLVYDPDFQSAPWEGQVREVASITAITSAQRDFIEANSANVGLAFSSADFYVSPGQNMNGRAVYGIVSADWFRARVEEDFALLKLNATARGQKLIVDATGQAQGLAILNGRLQQGESAGHFVKGQTRATAETISDDDIENRRLRFKVEAQIAADARIFVFNVYLQPNALQAA